MDKRGKWAGAFGAFALLILLTATVYVGGYLGLSTRQSVHAHDDKFLVLRSFKYQWLSEIYDPLARVESSATGNYVIVVSEDAATAP